MYRNLLPVAVVALVALPAQGAPTIRVANLAAILGARECGAAGPPRSAIEKFMLSQVVVAGKVVSIERDSVEATAAYAGAKEKEKYRIAVVKIDTAILGAEKLKEIRVGFVPWPKRGPNDRPLRTDVLLPELKEGQEWLFFLAKHPAADFHVMETMNRPADLKTDHAKTELEVARRCGAVLADPMKGLKSDKAETRAEAAAILLIRHRSCPGLVAETEPVAIPAEENKLILRGLAESDWRYQGPRPHGTYVPLAHIAFWHLRLTEKDGWVEPVIVPSPPGVPPPDTGAVIGDAYGQWLNGPGKNYTIKKLVPKK